MVYSITGNLPIYAPSRHTGPLPGRPIQLLIAEGRAAYREELRRICAAESDLHILGEAENGVQAIDLARELKPDVVLMNIKMPVIDGIQATRHITAIRPDVGIILLTVYRDTDILVKAVQAGARAHLTQDVEAGKLVETIRLVYRGEAYIDSQVTARVLDAMRREVAAREPVTKSPGQARSVSHRLKPV